MLHCTWRPSGLATGLHGQGYDKHSYALTFPVWTWLIVCSMVKSSKPNAMQALTSQYTSSSSAVLFTTDKSSSTTWTWHCLRDDVVSDWRWISAAWHHVSIVKHLDERRTRSGPRLATDSSILHCFISFIGYYKPPSAGCRCKTSASSHTVWWRKTNWHLKLG